MFKFDACRLFSYIQGISKFLKRYYEILDQKPMRTQVIEERKKISGKRVRLCTKLFQVQIIIFLYVVHFLLMGIL